MLTALGVSEGQGDSSGVFKAAKKTVFVMSLERNLVALFCRGGRTVGITFVGFRRVLILASIMTEALAL